MKNKLLFIVFLGAVFLFCGSAICAADDFYSYYKHVELFVGDREAEVNHETTMMPQPAYAKGGRTLVPFRFLGESLGATIAWDANKQQAKLTMGDNQVTVTVGSQAAYVNNKPVTLDVPAEISNGSLFVPLRFMSESLGAAVDYDSDLELITVDCVNSADWEWYTAPITEIKYKHPRDWTVSTKKENNVVVFTSPHGSELGIYAVDISPKDTYAPVKKTAEENGWEYEWETLNVPGDINQGYQLVYSAYDEEKDAYLWYIIEVGQLEDQCSLVSEMFADEDSFDVDPYIGSIIFNS